MPIYPGEVCTICNESINLTWICLDCHKIFCDDCVELRPKTQFICLDCQSREYEVNHHGEKICKNCQGHHFQEINNAVSVCRNCGSENIVRITEMQQSLIDKYKQIINQTRGFAGPIKDTVEILNIYRTKLYQLRKDHPPAYHYPNLEAELIMVISLFDNIKTELFDRVFHFFQEILRNIHFIKEIKITHPGNLTYISEIIEYFERERVKVDNGIRSKIENISPKMEKIESQIEFMESVQGNFMKYLNKLKLEPDEKIVYFQNCKLSNGKNPDDDFSNKNGTIMLTSKRLYFLHEQGLFRKQTVVLFRVLVEDIESAGVKGKLFKKVSLESLNSMYNFKLPKIERDKLLDWIERAREFDQNTQIDQDSWQKLNRAKINASVFQEQLEQAIYELIGFHGSDQLYFGNDPSMIVNENLLRTQHLPNNNPRHSFSKTPSYSNSSSKNINRFPPSVSNQNTIRTHTGHFGYPHDQRPPSYTPQNYHTKAYSPFKQRVNHLENSMNTPASDLDWRKKIPYPPSNNQTAYASPIHNPQAVFQNEINSYEQDHFNYDSSGNVQYNNHLSNPRPMENGDQKFQLQSQLQHLREEEYSLKNTLEMLENRYDSGKIPHEIFIKEFQEINRQHFKIITHIRELEQAIQSLYI